MLLRVIALNANRNIVINTCGHLFNRQVLSSECAAFDTNFFINSSKCLYSSKAQSKVFQKRDDFGSTESKHEHKIKNTSVPKRKLFLKQDPDGFDAASRLPTDDVPPIEHDEGDAAEETHFENIPFRRNQLSLKQYATLIKQHIRYKRLKEAIDILEVRMKEDRVKPDNYIYDLLIVECGRMGFDKKAFQLYNRMKQRSLRVTGPTYTALFNACSNSPFPKAALERAEHLRKTMIQNGYHPNEINYNTMIKAFGRCGDFKTAFELVDEMKATKLPLKVATINHLLQVCCEDKEFGFRHALLVWHTMYRRKLMPDAYSFNLMLRCTRDCGVGDIKTMQQMIANILNQSRSTLKASKIRNQTLLIEDKPSKAINDAESGGKEDQLVADRSSSEVDETSEVCDQMPNFIAKLPHLGSLVSLSEIKSAQDRLLLLGGLSGVCDEIEAAKVRPDVKTFSQLLFTLPSTRDAENELIQKMKELRIRADTDFFNLLIKRRMLRQDKEGAKQILNIMDKVNLHPDIVTYGVLAMGCATRQEARDFLSDLSDQNIKVNIEILGALLKNACYAKDYAYVIDILTITIEENIQPSEKFLQIISNFKRSRYNALQNKPNADEQVEFNQFYRTYLKFKEAIGFTGSYDDFVKTLREHPWKQFKESQVDGAEILKNSYIQRLWKKRHVIQKVTPARLGVKRQRHKKDEHSTETAKE